MHIMEHRVTIATTSRITPATAEPTPATMVMRTRPEPASGQASQLAPPQSTPCKHTEAQARAHTHTQPQPRAQWHTHRGTGATPHTLGHTLVDDTVHVRSSGPHTFARRSVGAGVAFFELFSSTRKPHARTWATTRAVARPCGDNHDHAPPRCRYGRRQRRSPGPREGTHTRPAPPKSRRRTWCTLHRCTRRSNRRCRRRAGTRRGRSTPARAAEGDHAG